MLGRMMLGAMLMVALVSVTPALAGPREDGRDAILRAAVREVKRSGYGDEKWTVRVTSCYTRRSGVRCIVGTHVWPRRGARIVCRGRGVAFASGAVQLAQKCGRR